MGKNTRVQLLSRRWSSLKGSFQKCLQHEGAFVLSNTRPNSQNFLFSKLTLGFKKTKAFVLQVTSMLLYGLCGHNF